MIFLHFPLDSGTPTERPAYEHRIEQGTEARDVPVRADWLPRTPRRVSARWVTTTLTEQVNAWWVAGLGVESRTESVHRGSEADRENAQRLELLVRKAARNLNPEEEARLRIATEKVRRLIPRVTAADFELLADLVTQSEHAMQEDRELRESLDLDLDE